MINRDSDIDEIKIFKTISKINLSSSKLKDWNEVESAGEEITNSYLEYNHIPWYDIMQVCLNGHVVNSSYTKSPNDNKNYCSQCGAKTIIECEKCKKKFRGTQYRPTIDKNYIVPSFCENCGFQFSWYSKSEALFDSPLLSHYPSQYNLEIIEKLLANFHHVVRQLQKRRQGRPLFINNIKDEYDIQDILRILLYGYFDDVVPEEYTPNYAGKSSKIDFLLKNNKIAIETKIANDIHGDKQIGDEIIVDITRYKEHEDCNCLVCLIYDPNSVINNPMLFKESIEKKSDDNFTIRISITH